MTTFKKHLHKAIDELDKTLALMGLVAAGILTVWVLVDIDHRIFAIVPVLTFFACAIYLLIRKHLSLSTIPSLDQISASPRLYTALNTLFFLLFSYSIISVHLRPDPYVRPLEYFILTSLMAAVVAVEILFLPRKSHTYLALFKIIIIGLSLRWSQQLIFPSLIGPDPMGHEGFVLQILDAGHVLPILGQYYYLPIFHLLSGVTILVTNLDYRMAVMFSIVFFQVVCDMLFIFLLGRFVLGHKVGLLAALLLSVANVHIMWGFFTIPNTLAATMIPPVLYLIFKMKKEISVRYISLALLFMIALILTHAFALWLAMLLFMFWIGCKIRNRLYLERSVMPATFGIAIPFTTLMVGYWMHISPHLGMIAGFIRGGFGEHLLRVVCGPLAEEAARQALLVPFWEQLFNAIGAFLFFALSFIGCFYMVSKRFSNINAFVFAIACGTILVISFIPVVTGFGIGEERWQYFSQIMMAIPLSIALLLICQVYKSKLTKAGLISFMVFVLAFLMVVSSMANMNYTFAPNTSVRIAFTESELTAKGTISHIWDGDIGGDQHLHWLGLSFPPRFEGEIIDIGESLFTGDFRDRHDILIIIREEIVHRPVHISPLVGRIRIDYDPRPTLAEQGFSRIYDSGSVSSFVNLQN